MPRPVPRPKRISEFKPLFDNVAQTSHYQMRFGGFGPALRQHLSRKGVGPRFVGEDIGLLCSNAIIPGSSLATSEIMGDHMGVIEKIAHSRLFTEMQLEFYVDDAYKSLKFLEHWIEFIAGGSRNSDIQGGYAFRMRYPDEYKTDACRIVKFDRDYDKYIEYTFYGFFPRALNDTIVNYEGSQIMKITASFTYERYVSGETTSQAWWSGIDRNNTANQTLNSRSAARTGIINPVDFFNRQIPTSLWNNQTGANFARNVARGAVSTLAGSMLGSGSSSTFDIF